jgi:hypothetical protein
MTRLTLCSLIAAVALPWSGAATAATLPTAALASKTQAATTQIGDRWYSDDDDDNYYDGDDDDYYYPPEDYLRPPPPVVRVVPAPPAVVYEPPVYGWISPPRPATCGKYRYWNGEYCADARYDPPYTGPRW